MYFKDIRKVGFDTETTGPDPETARIVTAALVVRGGGRPDQDYTWLINPGEPIPAEATEVHGITDAMVQADGLDPKTALGQIADMLARALAFRMPVIAFNLSFDWTVLDRDLRRHGLTTMEQRLAGHTELALIDPHVIDKQVDRYRKGTGMRKLKPTSEIYGIELTDWHTAEADALAALLIAEAQFARYPGLEAYGAIGLFRAQQAWRAEQQAGLQDWFRTKATVEQGGDPGKVIDGAWPMRPFSAAVTV
ncbi:exonuclease domain-containing protein [Kitasatospora sp. NPDC057223]|uniref:exonuclease domain-containing protein n=1 Tax=Kitasatospora sp. NPDC057223 TaxID=3346055 RepID=UPI003633D6CB